MSCPDCQGTGKLPVDEHTIRWCRCVELKERLRFLGDFGPSLKGYNPTSCPLAERVGEHMIAKRKSFIITGAWSEVRPHLAFALLCLRAPDPVGFNFRLVTSSELRTNYFEDEDVRFSRWVQEPSLLIVRLDHLRVRNEGASQVIEETLVSREDDKLTWLVTDRAYPFGRSHRLYTKELAQLVDERLEAIAIGGVQ